MPFTETDIVDERTRFIEDAHRSLHSFTWLCQHYGISRETFDPLSGYIPETYFVIAPSTTGRDCGPSAA